MRLLSLLLLLLFLSGCAWHNKDYSLILGIGEFSEKHPDGTERKAKTQWPRLIDVTIGAQ